MSRSASLGLVALLSTLSAPAMACGPSSPLEVAIIGSLVTLPLVIVLVGERLLFALAMRSLKVPRQHQPSWTIPLVALGALGIAIFARGVFHSNDAIVLALGLPLAALQLSVSFLRSVGIEHRGTYAPRALRVVGVLLAVAAIYGSVFFRI